MSPADIVNATTMAVAFKAPISNTERVKARLNARNYVSVTQIAVDTRLSASQVLNALDLLERQNGIGEYLDVSSANNVSVALRAPRSTANAGGAA
jgi:hypothetical protein